MADATTIKVPRELRDRIAEHARRERVPLAVVIARALDDADERAFWAAVGAENSRLTEEDRAAYLPDLTLADALGDPDDDEVSVRADW